MDENIEFETDDFDDPEMGSESTELSTTAVAALAALTGAAVTAGVCWVRRNRDAIKEKYEARRAAKETVPAPAETEEKDN